VTANDKRRSERLSRLSAKLRALGYLFENLDPEVSKPEDVYEVHLGIGLLLNDLSVRASRMSGEIEKDELTAK
jgi:hypothetical protein